MTDLFANESHKSFGAYALSLLAGDGDWTTGGCITREKYAAYVRLLRIDNMSWSACFATRRIILATVRHVAGAILCPAMGTNYVRCSREDA